MISQQQMNSVQFISDCVGVLQDFRAYQSILYQSVPDLLEHVLSFLVIHWNRGTAWKELTAYCHEFLQYFFKNTF